MAAVETNTCTTLTVRNDEIAKYLTREMQAVAKLFIGCAICGTTTAKDFFSICGHRAHHACGPCAKVTSKVCKIEQTRAGPKKCCGADGCKAEFEGPKLDPVFGERLRAFHAFADAAVRLEKDHQERGTTGEERRREAVEALRARRGAKRKKDCETEEELAAWKAENDARKVAKAQRLMDKEHQRLQARLAPHQAHELIRIWGQNEYEVWRDAIFAMPEVEDVVIDDVD